MGQAPWTLLKCKHTSTCKHKTSSNYDHLIIWQSSVTFTFNVPEQIFQMALLLLKENNCQIILKSMHKCRGYGLDKPNLWPFYHSIFKCDLDRQSTWTNISNGTATTQEKLLYQIILKSMLKVEVMARTSSIYDHFIIWPSSVTLTFNMPEQMFQMTQEQLCQILKSMHKCRSYGPDKLN